MLPFWLSIGVLSLVAGRPRGRARAAIATPLLTGLREPLVGARSCRCSIAVVVGAIALESASADFLTYLALIAVPPLAALALAGARARRPAAAGPAGGAALRPRLGRQGDLGGDTAALALSALACVSLGWLLVCVVPGRWLKLGIYAMAAIDAYLVGSNLLQEPNATLNAASRRRPAEASSSSPSAPP